VIPQKSALAGKRLPGLPFFAYPPPVLQGKEILLLEDEALLRKTLVAFLEGKDAEVFAATNVAEARNLMESLRPDYALLDVNLPDGRGIDLLTQPGFSNTTKVVIMTADGGIQTAVEAIKAGASDYLAKPFEVEELPLIFGRLDRESSRKRIDNFKRETARSLSETLFTGERLAFIQSQIDRILAADQRLQTTPPPILIEGETGTGKSTIARLIHQQGPRAQQPLIEINCATLPENLAESELFGHEKGAFTDARKERIGLFEAAEGGTLFLDEIASLSLPVQAKILTAIEDQRIRRLGDTRSRPINARLIAASLHPLEALVKEGTFREDLFHRLSLLNLTVPPLRSYPEDIPELARHLLVSLKQRYRREDITLSADALKVLLSHPWPGNVRELIHELERSLIFSEGSSLDLMGSSTEVNPEGARNSLLNPAWRLPEEGFLLEEALQELSQDLIKEAMDSCGGNVSAAARRLGVSRDYLRYRLA
jgi:two-component system response regulator AtoC